MAGGGGSLDAAVAIVHHSNSCHSFQTYIQTVSYYDGSSCGRSCEVPRIKLDLQNPRTHNDWFDQSKDFY